MPATPTVLMATNWSRSRARFRTPEVGPARRGGLQPETRPSSRGSTFNCQARA
jgi:hypothetical protein